MLVETANNPAKTSLPGRDRCPSRVQMQNVCPRFLQALLNHRLRQAGVWGVDFHGENGVFSQHAWLGRHIGAGRQAVETEFTLFLVALVLPEIVEDLFLEPDNEVDGGTICKPKDEDCPQ